MMQSNSSDTYVHLQDINIFHLFDPELQLSNTMIKNKLENSLSGLNKFEVQTILVLQHKRRDDCKIYHPSAKITATD